MQIEIKYRYICMSGQLRSWLKLVPMQEGLLIMYLPSPDSYRAYKQEITLLSNFIAHYVRNTVY